MAVRIYINPQSGFEILLAHTHLRAYPYAFVDRSSAKATARALGYTVVL